MPAGSRIPKGSYNRPTPDWFTGALSSAGFLFNDSTGNFFQISLFNDATDGSYLWVYGLAIACQSSKLNCFPINPVNGALQGKGFSAITGTGATPGSIYLYNDPAPPPQWANFLTLNAFDLQAESPITPLTIFPGFPIAVLAPGWAFAVNSVTPGGDLVSVTFWWVALKP